VAANLLPYWGRNGTSPKSLAGFEGPFRGESKRKEGTEENTPLPK